MAQGNYLLNVFFSGVGEGGGGTGEGTSTEDLAEVSLLTYCRHVQDALSAALALSSHLNTSTYEEPPNWFNGDVYGQTQQLKFAKCLYWWQKIGTVWGCSLWAAQRNQRAWYLLQQIYPQRRFPQISTTKGLSVRWPPPLNWGNSVWAKQTYVWNSKDFRKCGI